MKEQINELPIIQKTYDLILWYIPRINKFPRDFKFVLGDRIRTNLYNLFVGATLCGCPPLWIDFFYWGNHIGLPLRIYLV